MASGLPVITTRGVGAAELVTPQCGIVLNDHDDVDALARAMLYLMEDSSRRVIMGRSAREVAIKHSWKRMAQQYIALYEEIAGRN